MRFRLFKRQAKSPKLFDSYTLTRDRGLRTHKSTSINPKKRISRISGLICVLIVIGLVLTNVYQTKAAYSFQTNYNDGSYDAFYALGSATAATDTAYPTLTDSGYGGTKSLQYTYDAAPPPLNTPLPPTSPPTKARLS